MKKTFYNYRRANDGRKVTIEYKGQFYAFDNRYVVPNNEYFLGKYQCHMNFQMVATSDVMSYILKYFPGDHIYSQQKDEVFSYMENRVVNSYEAVWRLLEFPINHRSHPVVLLPVHLDGEGYARKGIISKLEAWFLLNQTNAEARKYLYEEIPEHYVWEKNM